MKTVWGSFRSPFLFVRPMRPAHGDKVALAVVRICSNIIFSSCETGKPFGPTIAKTKGNTVKSLIASYRAAAAKRALYRRTRDEIAGMPRSVALDLGIFPEDAARIARQAVWG